MVIFLILLISYSHASIQISSLSNFAEFFFSFSLDLLHLPRKNYYFFQYHLLKIQLLQIIYIPYLFNQLLIVS